MKDVNETLNGIAEKVLRLGEKLKEAEGERAALKEENQQLQAQLLERDHHIRQLEININRLQGALEQWQRERPLRVEEFRMEIDQHISRIDKCVKWLEEN